MTLPATHDAVADAPANEGAGALAPGALLADRYVLREAAGSGGFGAVYRAHDRVAGEAVAIKVLHDVSHIDDRAARFAQEVKALERLSRPSIVRLLDHDIRTDGMAYLVMEAVPGVTLRDHLDGKPMRRLSVVEAIDRAVSVLDALAAAHSVGVVHRDIKPTNVMVCSRHDIRVIDFGVALLDADRLTRKGMGLGTIAYAAPEQARGEPVPASDQYAVGVMLYEMLSSRLPFDASGEMALAVAHQRLPPPRLPATLGVPEAVEEIVRRALAKDASARFASAAEMASALIAARPGPPVLPFYAPTARLARRETATVAALETGNGSLDGSRRGGPAQSDPAVTPAEPIADPLVDRPGAAVDAASVRSPDSAPLHRIERPARRARRKVLVAGGAVGLLWVAWLVAHGGSAPAAGGVDAGLAVGSPGEVSPDASALDVMPASSARSASDGTGPSSVADAGSAPARDASPGPIAVAGERSVKHRPRPMAPPSAARRSGADRRSPGARSAAARAMPRRGTRRVAGEAGADRQETSASPAAASPHDPLDDISDW